MVERDELRIGMYAGSWPQNIGNAFFDFGAEAIIKLAFPKSKIYRTGGAVHWMFNNSSPFRNGNLGKVSRRIFPNWNPQNKNSIEIGEIAKLDILIFAGMSLSIEFVQNNGATLLEANKRGVSILGLGVGASAFSKKEAEVFAKFFNKLENSALITRDSKSYDLFAKRIDKIELGIDCAFFLPEYFSPPEVVITPYSVATFDFIKIPKFLLNRRDVYFSHHDLWGRLPRKYIKKARTLISDVPEDYLTLYANCETTYSDRVHACVASLAFGNKAQLFSETPRKALFSGVGIDDITKEPVMLDKEKILIQKNIQIQKTKDLIKAMLSNHD